MVEIGGRPILWHIMKTYAHHGLREFVLCLGYKGNVVKDYFLNYAAMNGDFTTTLGRNRMIAFHDRCAEENFTVTLAETGAETMTGGRIARIQRYIQDDAGFVMTYGDGLSDLDVGMMLDFHRSHGKLATIMTVRPSTRFGAVEMAHQRRVFRFAEKPRAEGWCSGGVFVLRPEVFGYLGGDDCVFERSPLERLAADGQLMAYQHEGFSYAMDTYCEYLHLNELWAKGNAPWKVWDDTPIPAKPAVPAEHTEAWVARR